MPLKDISEYGNRILSMGSEREGLKRLSGNSDMLPEIRIPFIEGY